MTHVEWGIRYRSEDPTMDEPEGRTVTMKVASEDVARAATKWDHGAWKGREVKVVRREVTEWEEV